MNSPQIAIVTGVSSGIGFFLANYLANHDFIVYGILRNEVKFQKNMEQYQFSRKENLHIVPMDVRNFTKTKELINQIYFKHNRIDVLVNNAGYGLYGPLEELDEKEIRDQFETNFFAPMVWIKLVLPIMRNQQSGKIINIASILGRVTIPTGSAYCSAKHALVALSEALRYEVSPFGIQVCSVEPGLVRTDFKDNMKLSAEIDHKTSPYYKLNQKIKQQLGRYPNYATSAETAAKKIMNLIQRENLPPHYLIGVDAGFYLNLKNLLPEGVWDFVLKTFTKSVMK
ncbi:MAG: SDR family oxidoreductase [Leptospiraceae bacterium]|nr:SDR family oxidoreductase [Leptospiraceae bacterium]MDW7976018.1 SDR family oxidoreductase [Leptospiraceae bacterium]